jgi:hypothetical protein
MAFDSAPRYPAIAATWLVLSIAHAASPPRANADGTPSKTQLARDLMKRASQLRAAHDFAGALHAFRAADDIMHVPTTGFEVARAEVQLGQLVLAHNTLEQVRMIPAPSDEPQAFKDAREYARLLEEEIRPRIPKIRLHVDAGGGHGSGDSVAVSVDGERNRLAAFDIPYEIDPGRHTLAARAADGTTAIQDVIVREGEERDVVLALASGAPAPPPSIAPEPVPPQPTAKSGHPLAWIAFATAGAAAVAGAITGIESFSHEHSAAARCAGNQCPPSTYADLDAAHGFATASTISFVVAGAAAALGVVALLTTHDRAPTVAPPAARRASPWVGFGAAGLGGAF